MEFEFHPQQWLDILAHYPWFVPLLGGPLTGAAFTQLIKKTYLAFYPMPVSDARYTASVRWLAVVSTYGFTQLLWPFFVNHEPTGLGHLVSAISGVCAPSSYTLTKAAIAWKFPDLAKRLGDD
jgi:hypothetical protein